MTVGKMLLGLQKGKTLIVASLCAGHFTLLVNQTDIFPLFVYMLESPRLPPFTLQLSQAVFHPLLLSDHQESKPVSQDR
jgi:hypothetical protein